ncbi:MAG TPA: lipopolysaccharide heptosyltransferase II, partial [Xanthobacteraceae bacterium]|nr:lipopolysaccharide heptosyltransferase II [Xanthobacteraceae bacterium]
MADHMMSESPQSAPILIIPYMWIGDFVRCHTVVRLLRERFPDRPVDMLSTTLCAPLAD